MCHVSRVTCHMSIFLFFLCLKKNENKSEICFSFFNPAKQNGQSGGANRYLGAQLRLRL